jgi:hypothetical protein
MLDTKTIVQEYAELKASTENTYAVLKKEPSVTNAAAYTTAVQAFTNFCVDTMARLAGQPKDGASNETILELVERYCSKTVCADCSQVEDYIACPYKEIKELYLQSKN